MPPEPHPSPPAAELQELMVQCLEAFEHQGAPGVAALLAAHPDQAARLLDRLVILGDLGLLPEAGRPGESSASAG